MSVLTRPDSVTTAKSRAPMQSGLTTEQLTAALNECFGAIRDARDRWGITMIVTADKLREAVLFLRDEPTLSCNMLLDISAIDYLSYPNFRGPRFAVVYLFKSLVFRHRVALKVEIEEETPAVPSIHDLFLIADWAEREVWDQVGIVFTGHPNLKRLLNHHEFVGHPLRKDYPCQKRQKLSMNDPMLDQLTARLVERGFTVLDTPEVHQGRPISAIAAVDGVSAGAGATR